MTKSYRTVFIALIILTIANFIIASMARQLPLPAVLGGWFVWLMHKQQNESIIQFCKVLLWIGCITLLVFTLTLIFRGPNASQILGFTWGWGTAVSIFLSVCIYFGLLKFIQSHVNNNGGTRVNPDNNSSNKNYLRAEEEFATELRDKGLWARCFAEADGNESIAKARYLKQWVAQLEITAPLEMENTSQDKAKWPFSSLILVIFPILLLLIYLTYQSLNDAEEIATQTDTGETISPKIESTPEIIDPNLVKMNPMKSKGKLITFSITGPDGTVYHIDSPSGTPREDIIKEIQRQLTNTKFAKALEVLSSSPPQSFITQRGLTWMPVSFKMNWKEANRFCNENTINGLTGWRMPTISELRGAPAGIFVKNNTNAGVYSTWSSSSASNLWIDTVGSGHKIAMHSGGIHISSLDASGESEELVGCVRSD